MSNPFSQSVPNDSYHDPQYYTRRSLPDYTNVENDTPNLKSDSDDYQIQLYHPVTQSNTDDEKNTKNQEFEHVDLDQFLDTNQPKEANDLKQPNTNEQVKEESIVPYVGAGTSNEIVDHSARAYEFIQSRSDSYNGSMRKRKDDSTETTYDGNESTLFDDKDINRKYNYFTTDEVFRDDDIADLNKDSMRQYEKEEELDNKKNDRTHFWNRFVNRVKGLGSRGPIVQNPKVQHIIHKTVFVLTWVATSFVAFVIADCEFVLVHDPQLVQYKGQGLFTEGIYNDYNDRIGCLRYNPADSVSMPMFVSRVLSCVTLVALFICSVIVSAWFLFDENTKRKRRIHTSTRIMYPVLCFLTVQQFYKMTHIQECIVSNIDCLLGGAARINIAASIVLFILSVLVMIVSPPEIPYYVFNYKLLPMDDADKFNGNGNSQPLLESDENGSDPNKNNECLPSNEPYDVEEGKPPASFNDKTQDPLLGDCDNAKDGNEAINRSRNGLIPSETRIVPYVGERGLVPFAPNNGMYHPEYDLSGQFPFDLENNVEASPDGQPKLDQPASSYPHSFENTPNNRYESSPDFLPNNRSGPSFEYQPNNGTTTYHPYQPNAEDSPVYPCPMFNGYQPNSEYQPHQSNTPKTNDTLIADMEPTGSTSSNAVPFSSSDPTNSKSSVDDNPPFEFPPTAAPAPTGIASEPTLSSPLNTKTDALNCVPSDSDRSEVDPNDATSAPTPTLINRPGKSDIQSVNPLISKDTRPGVFSDENPRALLSNSTIPIHQKELIQEQRGPAKGNSNSEDKHQPSVGYTDQDQIMCTDASAPSSQKKASKPTSSASKNKSGKEPLKKVGADKDSDRRTPESFASPTRPKSNRSQDGVADALKRSPTKERKSAKRQGSAKNVLIKVEDDNETSYDYNDPKAKVRVETTMERVPGGMKRIDFIFRSDGRMITKEKFIPDETV